MGFPEVFDYKAGKVNWIAMGQPSVHRDTRERIEQVARKDAPTCALLDTLESVRAKLPKDWNVCVVLNSDRIVLGLIDFSREVERDKSIGEIMRPAPLTLRPGQRVEDVCERFKSKDIPVALVTTSVGQFIGVLRRDEFCK